MKTFRTGLIVGKFAPLHRGHQVLLDEAERACDRLVILSYSDPEFPGCGPQRREHWLQSLYPDAMVRVFDGAGLADWCDATGQPRVALPPNDAPDDVHRRFVGRLLQAMPDVEVDAVFTSEAYGDGFAQVLNEMRLGRSPIVHIEVDRARSRVPVSGTSIRRDVHANRHFLDPLVYSDFVERIAILGGESTGKTSLAKALAERLETRWVAEYGRELWEAKGGRLEFPDMLRIAREQLRREQAACKSATRFVICDTTPLTTMLYSEAIFGRVDPILVDLAGRPYDHIFLCEPDFDFVQDGTRRDQAFQILQQRWYAAQLGKRRIPFQLLSGALQARVEKALGSIRIDIDACGFNCEPRHGS